MTTFFNQIIPRLARKVGRPAAAAQASGQAGEPEFTVKPAYEIKETTEAWGLSVHLPGVAKEGLELTAEEGLITIRGRRTWKQPEGWTSLYRVPRRAL